jgi:high affinity Mn2+ porin
MQGSRKYGFGFNAEQEITTNLGSFMRLGWNDGHTETWAFDEVDRTASIGAVLKGRKWNRPDDGVGLAGLVNALSPDHRAYLAAGGDGFLLGDGQLNYGTENILETYYSAQIVKHLTLTFDFQEIFHPGYNIDRGPVSVGAIRLHLEF